MMKPDNVLFLIGLIMAGKACFSIAIILLTSVALWRWRNANRSKQLAVVVDELESEDEAVVINSPVPGEEPIQRMPGPWNQPLFQRAIETLSTASSGPREVSEICQNDHLECTSLLSPSHWRNPQGRTPLSDSDESEEISTAHVRGKHAPGETCTICHTITRRCLQQQTCAWLANNMPISRGMMGPIQLGSSHRIDPFPSVSCVATTADLPPEGMGEANHTFSTFTVSPRVESIY